MARRSAGVGPMPLKSAKLPSPWRKKRSIGIMRSIALISAGGGATLRAAKAWRSGSRSTSSSISAPGVAADMAAVGQDLALQLVDQAPGGRFDQPLLSGHAQRRRGQRDDA